MSSKFLKNDDLSSVSGGSGASDISFSSVDEAIDFFRSAGMSEKDWDWDSYVKDMSKNRPGAAYMPNPRSWNNVSEEEALEEVSKCIGGGDYKSAASYLRGWKKFHG